MPISLNESRSSQTPGLIFSVEDLRCWPSLRSFRHQKLGVPLWRRSTASLPAYRGGGASLAHLFSPWQDSHRMLSTSRKSTPTSGFGHQVEEQSGNVGQ